MSDHGQRIYSALYPDDPERFPRGRKPYRVLPWYDREKFENAGEVVVEAVYDATLESLLRDLTSSDIDDTFTASEIAAWLITRRSVTAESISPDEWEAA